MGMRSTSNRILGGILEEGVEESCFSHIPKTSLVIHTSYTKL